MFAKGLLDNEVLTLYALNRYPLYNDRELSDIIPINMSTLTAIRNRLQRKGFIGTYRLPRPDFMGSEIFFSLCCEIRNPLNAEDRDILEREIRENFPDIFYSVYDIDSLFCMGFSNSYIDYQKRLILFVERLSVKNILVGGGSRSSIFPTTLSRITNYFDMSEFLHETLELEKALLQVVGDDRTRMDGIMETLRPPGGPSGEMILECERKNLRKKELKMLYGLVKDPDAPDERVARNMGVTRQSVSRSRKALEKKGILVTRKMPDLGRLGLGILAVCSLDFRPDQPRKKWADICGDALRENMAVFSIMGNFEVLAVFPCLDFASLKRLRSNLIYSLKESEYLCGPPLLFPISLPLGKVLKDFVFTPQMKSIYAVHPI